MVLNGPLELVRLKHLVFSRMVSSALSKKEEVWTEYLKTLSNSFHGIISITYEYTLNQFVLKTTRIEKNEMK